MLGGIFNKKPGPIGVDVGARGVRLLQLDMRGATPRVIAAAALPLPARLQTDDPGYAQTVAETIAQAANSADFIGNELIPCLPAQSLRYKNLRLPVMPDDELGPAVQWEAVERLGMPEGQKISVRYFKAGQVTQGDEQREEVIVLASTEQFIEQQVAALYDKHFVVLAVDAQPAALARVVRAVDDETTTRVLVDLGESATKVLILSGDRVRFFKSLDLGLHKFDKQLSEELGTSPGEASAARRDPAAQPEETRTKIEQNLGAWLAELAGEVSLCLRYDSVTFRGERPEKVWLTGSGASLPQWPQALSEEADLHAIVHNPFEGIDTDAAKDRLGDPARYATWGAAVGVARRTPVPVRAQRKGAA